MDRHTVCCPLKTGWNNKIKTISIPYNWTDVNRFLVACSSIDHLGYIYAIRVSSVVKIKISNLFVLGPYYLLKINHSTSVCVKNNYRSVYIVAFSLIAEGFFYSSTFG